MITSYKVVVTGFDEHGNEYIIDLDEHVFVHIDDAISEWEDQYTQDMIRR
jgi:hypothetical protein